MPLKIISPRQTQVKKHFPFVELGDTHELFAGIQDADAGLIFHLASNYYFFLKTEDEENFISVKKYMKVLDSGICGTELNYTLPKH